MKKIIINMLALLVWMILSQPLRSQQTTGVDTSRKAKIDSLLESYTIEDILNYRDFYEKQIKEFNIDKIKLRDRGIAQAEKFIANNPQSTMLDRVMIRLAELYYEAAEDDYLQRMQEYDQQMEQFESQGIDTTLVEPTKNLSRPLALYQRIIDEFPHSDLVDDALYNKAFLLEEIGQIDSALAIYQYVIDQFPESRYVPESLMRIGEYYFNPPKNEIERAIEYYKKVLQFKDSPKFDEALYRLGWSYYRLNNFPEAVSYFTLLADDIERAKSIDPRQRYSNPSLRDESLEYIGISFLDYGGTQRAVEYLNRIGGRSYGAEILKKIGDVYMYEKELYNEAIEAYHILLKMYPEHDEAPEIQEKIVACYRYMRDDRMAYVAREKLFHDYGPGSAWWQSHENERLRNKAYRIAERALRDNITLLFQRAEENNDEYLYLQAVNDSKKYISIFASDSSAPMIHWNMALVLDTKLNQKDAAFEEYMRMSDLYWNSRFQKFAAENAIALTKEMVESDTTKKKVAVDLSETDSTDRPQVGIPALQYRRLELTESEKKLIRAYNNYIKIFPHEPETFTVLSNAGAVYYNNNQFKEALRYFNTILKHFPDHPEVNNIRYIALESYFGKQDYKSAEIVARRLLKSQDISPQLERKARIRLAESIFLAAEAYANRDDHLQAGNEYLRVVREVPTAEFADLSLFNAALEFDKAREFSRAVETYNYLIETRPNSVYLLNAMNNLALDYGELNEPKNAALTYEKLASVAKDPNQAHDALFNASYFFARAEEWEDAIRVNRTFVQRFPDSKDAADLYFDIATYYLKLDKLDEANQVYGEYAVRYPNSPRVVETYFQRGEYYRAKNQFDRAINEYRLAVEKNEELAKKNLERNDYFAAEALFQMTQLKYDEYDKIEFQLPQARLEEAKKKKKELLMQIVDGYTKVAAYGTVRLYEATWHIGRSYEEFASTWGKQEIPPMEQTRRIIAQKQINEATVELYGKAEQSYKQAIQILSRLAKQYETSLIKNDTLSAAGASRDFVREDSTLHVARRWIERCKEKVSEVIYDAAELNFSTVDAFLQAPIPDGLNHVAEMEYRRQVLGKAITPLISEIIDAHRRNIQEAWNLGIENQWVKLSRKKILSANNLLAAEYQKLAQKSLELYEANLESYKQLVDRAEPGVDPAIFSDQLANLVDFSRAFAKMTAEIYQKTLEKAVQLNISDPLVAETRELMLRDLFVIAQRTQELADTLRANRKRYERLFRASNNINYEDALFTLEDNYLSLKEATVTLLELGLQLSQKLQLNNAWVPQIKLALVHANPEQYAALINLSVKTEQIVSDESWRATHRYVEGWVNPDFDDRTWDRASYVVRSSDRRHNSLTGIWLMVADSAGAQISGDSLLQTRSLDHPPSDRTTLKPSRQVFFRTSFQIEGLPVSAVIKLIVDDSYNLFCNGEYIAAVTSSESNWQIEHVHQLTDNLMEGNNELAIEAIDNDGSSGGLIAVLTLKSLPGWADKQQQIQLEASHYKVRQNLIMDKYIIMH
ncbi:MAG: tetratricopeptide repeat protein [candidate division KSB1 bacterium]|nr:tetratricopeptide repeat protein [candidate division KSB1 bacterium]